MNFANAMSAQIGRLVFPERLIQIHCIGQGSPREIPCNGTSRGVQYDAWCI